VNALADIAAAQAGAGKAEEARLIFARGRDVAQTIGDWRIASAQMGIAAAQARAGQVEDALQTAQAIGDPDQRAEALRAIAAAQAGARQAEEAQLTFVRAFQTAQGIGNPGQRAEALGAIAAAQAGAGQVEDALQTAEAIGNPGQRAEALGAIAAAQARAGQVEDALEMVQSIDDPYWRAKSLGDIAAAQARAGQAKEVRLTFAQALQAAQAIEAAYPRAKLLWDIAAACVDANDIESAQSSLKAALHANTAFFREKMGFLHPGYLVDDDEPTPGTAFLREDDRAQLFHRLACIQAKARLSVQAIASSSLILVARDKFLPGIASSFLGANDRTAFKELLIPCAAHLRSAWAVCGLLPRAYPEQISAIARVAVQFARPSA